MAGPICDQTVDLSCRLRRQADEARAKSRIFEIRKLIDPDDLEVHADQKIEVQIGLNLFQLEPGPHNDGGIRCAFDEKTDTAAADVTKICIETYSLSPRAARIQVQVSALVK